MSGTGDTRQELRERLARVLFQRAWVDHSEWDLVADYFRRDADAILSDPGLLVLRREDVERVPTLAISRTDEHIDGVPFSIHRKVGDPFCGDESICAQHEPVYRIKGAPDV